MHLFALLICTHISSGMCTYGCTPPCSSSCSTSPQCFRPLSLWKRLQGPELLRCLRQQNQSLTPGLQGLAFVQKKHILHLHGSGDFSAPVSSLQHLHQVEQEFLSETGPRQRPALDAHATLMSALFLCWKRTF